MAEVSSQVLYLEDKSPAGNLPTIKPDEIVRKIPEREGSERCGQIRDSPSGIAVFDSSLVDRGWSGPVIPRVL
jgi:hypothetical protein